MPHRPPRHRRHQASHPWLTLVQQCCCAFESSCAVVFVVVGSDALSLKQFCVAHQTMRATVRDTFNVKTSVGMKPCVLCRGIRCSFPHHGATCVKAATLQSSVSAAGTCAVVLPVAEDDERCCELLPARQTCTALWNAACRKAICCVSPAVVA